MTHVNYNEALFEEEARVAGIFPLGMVGDPEYPPEWLKELHDAIDQPGHSIFKALPELKPDARDASDWADALFWRGRAGLIVRYEVCLRRYEKPPSTSWYSGWGYYSSGYLHVETFEEIGPAVLEAARALHQANRQKAGAK